MRGTVPVCAVCQMVPQCFTRWWMHRTALCGFYFVHSLIYLFFQCRGAFIISGGMNPCKYIRGSVVYTRLWYTGTRYAMRTKWSRLCYLEYLYPVATEIVQHLGHNKCFWSLARFNSSFSCNILYTLTKMTSEIIQISSQDNSWCTQGEKNQRN